MTFLYFYTAIAIAIYIAFSLGWHMLFRLDRYDWAYRMSHIWISSFAIVLLWPILFFRPAFLLQPNRTLKDRVGIATWRRKWGNLYENPPPCGRTIRYRQDDFRCGKNDGVFLFEASDVEELLRKQLEGSEGSSLSDEDAVLRWVAHRDNTIEAPSNVPMLWSGFKRIADKLIRTNHGQVSCLQCGNEIPVSQIINNDDFGKPGWNMDRLQCPRGHNLLVLEKIHLCVLRD